MKLAQSCSNCEVHNKLQQTIIHCSCAPLPGSKTFFLWSKVSWGTLFIIWHSRQRLGIKVQSCLVLR